jgi:hypothetical protein
MVRRSVLLLVTFAALIVVPSALGAFPAPYAVQGGDGVLSSDGSTQFVALKSGANTLVKAVATETGSTVRQQTVSGAFGVPVLTQSGFAGGLFHDGSALVLQNVGLERTSRFVILDTQSLAMRDTIALKGTFGFDALSPDGSRLYLIQLTSTDDIEHYIVRAYDLATHTLLPGRIADKTQKSWVMQGWAISRATTLYANPGGYPFIHALDTVRGVAHCIGLPWTAVQDPVYNFRLALKGSKLAVKWQDGRTWRRVDTRSWRITKP